MARAENTSRRWRTCLVRAVHVRVKPSDCFSRGDLNGEMCDVMQSRCRAQGECWYRENLCVCVLGGGDVHRVEVVDCSVCEPLCSCRSASHLPVSMPYIVYICLHGWGYLHRFATTFCRLTAICLEMNPTARRPAARSALPSAHVTDKLSDATSESQYHL